MGYRYMRVIVMFDMPTMSQKNLRDYRQFHKFLTKEGFIMMQESVYCKLALNSSISDAVKERVKKNKPPIGNV
ncbi:MAG: CRISPR-associated endonuclease Cas2, partial [Clostridia bacterium]